MFGISLCLLFLLASLRQLVLCQRLAFILRHLVCYSTCSQMCFVCMLFCFNQGSALSLYRIQVLLI